MCCNPHTHMHKVYVDPIFAKEIREKCDISECVRNKSEQRGITSRFLQSENISVYF